MILESTHIGAGAPDTTEISRYGYLDTDSRAGSPGHYTFHPRDVLEVRRWHNVYGNPSYTLRIAGADGLHTLYLVDDYGGVNDLRYGIAYEVRTRRDLFRGWL